ncbi:hypothetical protein BOX17_00390 [Halomonas aestuarii]|uniref:Uncharacterized protein n=1 Tax=Halomonas aestuarii TaxID=1897729 RepID=A0A1J0VBY9_9GAMM|nr:hypothetical protein [Halomonas aestuarii]APE29550.1 hypothetical protein BOX17_00390 [Halomonas aestuarii]
MNAPRQRARLVALVVLTALLFSPPLLLIAASPAAPGRLVVYVFVAWGTAIGLMAWLMERREED